MADGKLNSLTNPGPEEAAQFVEEALSFDNLITLAGICSVDYEGRASSFFDYCDCFVVIKPDGTFLIHQRDGRKPKNWQPPGCTFTVKSTTGELIIIGERDSDNERVELRSPEVYQISSYDIDEPVEKQLFGTEEHMQELILSEPDVLEDGFKPKEAERSISSGAIDIFGYDADMNPVIVELKRRRAGPEAVDQLKRYMDTYGDKVDGETRGILVAPSFTDTTIERLESEKLEYVHLEPPREEVESDKVTLENFEN